MLSEQIKALARRRGFDEQKLTEMAVMGVSEDTLERLLGDVEQAEKSADQAGVRFKETVFMANHATRTKEHIEGDAIEQMCEGLPDSSVDAVWKCYVDKGYAAAVGAASGYRASQLVARQKASDPVQPAVDRYVAALRAQMGDDAVIAHFEQLQRALDGGQQATAAGVMTDAGPQSVKKGKARQPDLLAATIAKNFNGQT